MDSYRTPQAGLGIMNGSSAMSSAEKFEDEKKRIVESCFNRTTDDGSLVESYITHIRVIEDGTYPSAPPPPNSNPDLKKPRIVIVAVRNSGRVRMHKARENANGSFSIGKTWPLDDLSAVESFSGSNPTTTEGQQRKQWAGGAGFTVTLGKPYYWQANTQKEKQFFIASLVKIFLKYTGGKSPELIGFDEKEKEQLIGVSPQAQSSPSVQNVTATIQPSPSVTPTPQSRAPRRPPSREQPSRQPASEPPRQPLPEPLPRSVPSEPPVQYPAGLTSQTSRPSLQSRSEKSPNSSFDYGVTSQASQSNLRRTAPGNQSQDSFSKSDESSLPPRSRNGMNGLPHAAGRFQDRTMTPGSLRTGTPDSVASSNRDVNVEPPPVTAPLSLPPERRRPPLGQLPDTARTRRQGSNDDMIPAPLMSPAMRRDDIKVPKRSMEREQVSNAREPPPVASQTPPPTIREQPSVARPPQQNFGKRPSTGSISKVDEAPKIPNRMASSKKSTDSLPIIQQDTVRNGETTPNGDSAQSIPAIPLPPAPAEIKDEDRPGLGPMIKKKSKADIANSFRKAATAANAFKPRAGGAAERLREQVLNKSDGPDGITGVVPAPLLRGAKNDIASPLPSAALSRGAADDVSRNATPDSSAKGRPMSPRKNDSIPEVKITVPQSDRPSSIEVPKTAKSETPVTEKTKPREPRRPKTVSDRWQKDLGSIGVESSLLGDRGVMFMNLYDDFGWVGDGVRTRNVDEMRTDIERELNKAQAGGWLSRFEEEDDRIGAIKKGIDTCIAEAEELDGLLTLYSVELDTLTEDIAYIEAQSQGLQVQAANQKLLQTELKSLLDTISIPSSDLQSLRTGQWMTDLDQIEKSLVVLFSAMTKIDPNLTTPASRTSEDGSIRSSRIEGFGNGEYSNMRVVQEKKSVYRDESMMFLQRLKGHMSTSFMLAVDETRNQLQRESEGSLNRRTGRGRLDPKSHDSARKFLWKYHTLLLFAREINGMELDVMLRSYEDAFKPIYQEEFRTALSTWKKSARKPTGDEGDILFNHQAEKQNDGLATTARKLTVKRSQTLAKSLRSPLGENGSRTNLDKSQDGRLNPYEVFTIALEDMIPVILCEQNFLVGLFHLSSLDTQEFPDVVAATSAHLRQWGDLRRIQPMDPNRDLAMKVFHAMEDVYPFFSADVQSLIGWAVETDPLQGVGVMVSIERKLMEVEESSQEFLARTLKKLHASLAIQFSKVLDEQIRAIEDTKVKISKRKGVISFIRVFPSFSAALETMLISAEDLDVRGTINLAYARINKTMFESLKAIARVSPGAAKSGDALEDKERLNYEILLIENMNHFVSEVETRHNPVLEEWKEKAEKEYQKHLDEYLNKMLERPLEKLIPFIDKTEEAMKKLPAGASPSSIAAQTAYNKSSFKRIIAEYDSKTIRKGIDALRKRIDKHFTDGDEPGLSLDLIKKVNSACEKKYDDVERRLQIIIRDIFDNDVPIEWTRQDVSAAFSAKIR